MAWIARWGYVLDKPATPEGVLGRRPPELRELVEGLRLLVKEAATGASERAHSGRNNLLYAYQGTDFCYIQPHKRWVNLGFPHGTSLSDPAGLLEGTGKSLRHVKIRTAEDAAKADLRALLLKAYQVGGGRIGGGGARNVGYDQADEQSETTCSRSDNKMSGAK